MNFIKTDIDGVIVIEPKVFDDLFLCHCDLAAVSRQQDAREAIS